MLLRTVDSFTPIDRIPVEKCQQKIMFPFELTLFFSDMQVTIGDK
jgi:hypothetical protein